MRRIAQPLRLSPTFTQTSAQGAHSSRHNSEEFPSRNAFCETHRSDRHLLDSASGACFDPNDARTYLSRGVIYFKLGQMQQSIADYERSLKLDPNFVASLYGRGVAKLKLGDASGNADIEQAKAAQPNIDTVFARFFNIAP